MVGTPCEKGKGVESNASMESDIRICQHSCSVHRNIWCLILYEGVTDKNYHKVAPLTMFHVLNSFLKHVPPKDETKVSNRSGRRADKQARLQIAIKFTLYHSHENEQYANWNLCTSCTTSFSVSKSCVYRSCISIINACVYLVLHWHQRSVRKTFVKTKKPKKKFTFVQQKGSKVRFGETLRSDKQNNSLIC